MRAVVVALPLLLAATPALAVEPLPPCPLPSGMVIVSCPRAGCPGEGIHEGEAEPDFEGYWLARPTALTLLEIGLPRKALLEKASLTGMSCDLGPDGELVHCAAYPDSHTVDGPTSAQLATLAAQFKVGLKPRCEGGKRPKSVGIMVTYDYRTGAFAGTLHEPIIPADD